MKLFTLLLILILPLADIHAQDSIIAENVFRYEIINGSRTGARKVSEQNTYNNNGKLILQLYYSDTAANIIAYTLLFYDGGLLIGKDSYHDDNDIDSAVRYVYLPENLLKTEKQYVAINGKLQLYRQIRFAYEDTVPAETAVTNSKGKWIRKSKRITTDSSQIVITKYRKGTDRENYRLTRMNKKVEQGRIESVHIQKEYFDGRILEEHLEYVYNDRLNLIQKAILQDATGDTLRITQYRWNSDGTLLEKEITDKNGSYFGYWSYERKPYVVNLGKHELFPVGDD
jgi:hypothetical protein